MYLLDTNHCSWAMRGHPVMTQRLADIRRTPIRTFIIVRGELLYMAHGSDRIDENLRLVNRFLQGISVLPIDELTTDVYGQIKAAVLKRFGPRERSKRRHFQLHNLGFTDNDLWIAASALRHDLTVVTSDGDFMRIAAVTDLRHESWLGNGQ